MRIATKKLLAALLSSALLAGCGGADDSAAPPGADITPDQFSFTDQTNVATSAEITSAAVTITGINAPSPVTVVGGSYSVGCTAAFVTIAGTISNNQTVCVRHTSSASAGTATNTTLAVDGVSDVFTSTTVGAPAADITPDQFSFTDQTNVPTGSERTSSPVTISGTNAPAPASVIGGSYSINSGAFTVAPGSVNNGDTVQVRHTSAAIAGTATNTTLTVGGVSDTFTSTTAAAAATGSLLPFLAGNGDLRLLDPAAELAAGVNPRTVDQGLAPPPIDGDCKPDRLVADCFGKAQTFYTGTVAGTTVSNLHAARLAYINGGAVYKLDLTQNLESTLVLPAKISFLTDACRIVESETTDFGNIDNSAVVVERLGPDGLCGLRDQFPADSALDDNLVTVIRLNSPAADAGLDIPLVLTAGNPLHAQTDASGAITGYVSFEGSGADARLVRRDMNLANPTTLKELAQTDGGSIERADLTHLFVTATPDDSALTLFRVESNGTLSPDLYFFGSGSGNLIRHGLHDATHLYFSNDNLLLRILLDSASEIAAPAQVLTELDPGLRIDGNWALDTGATPDRVVFEAHDDGLTIASGVFSVEITASEALATPLANYPDSGGGSAYLLLATNGLTYINLTNHGEPAEDALKISTAGPIGSGTTFAGAYWAGSNRATSFDRVTDFAVPTQYIFLARHGADLTDTLSVFDPATGVEGVDIGTVENTGDFQAVKIAGLGRYALARAEIDRSGRDNDVYSLDAETAGSLAPLAETVGATDMPLGN